MVITFIILNRSFLGRSHSHSCFGKENKMSHSGVTHEVCSEERDPHKVVFPDNTSTNCTLLFRDDNSVLQKVGIEKARILKDYKFEEPYDKYVMSIVFPDNTEKDMTDADNLYAYRKDLRQTGIEIRIRSTPLTAQQSSWNSKDSVCLKD